MEIVQNEDLLTKAKVSGMERKRSLEEVSMDLDDAKATTSIPVFPPAKKEKSVMRELRKIRVPPNRLSPLKSNWNKIYTPVVEHLKLAIRFNLKSKSVEIATSKETVDPNALQKAADFMQAFIYGFDVDDALALMRLDDLYLDSFDIKDVKQTLQGDHVSRAIGRLAGKNGRTRFSIENATRTRIVLSDSRIHILGAFQNIQIARRAMCNLILGKPPSKVFGNLKAVCEKVKYRT